MKELFKKYIKTDIITVKYAKGTSDMRGKEFHTYNEIIYFMGGCGKFISDNMQIDLKPDLIMIIPKESYHQLCIKGNKDDYHRCVIHFNDIPALQQLISKNKGGVCVIDTDIHTKYLFEKIINLTQSKFDISTKTAVIFSVLTLLLEEISRMPENNGVLRNNETLSHKCIEIIDKNLCNKIIVAKISETLNVSKSCVAHIFKKEMNISIYKYILEKRLILAHNKILDGMPATLVALECGFSDYSGFYKQYKKMFNTAPSYSKKDVRL